VILLDTNILSALMRDSPDPTVLRWLDTQVSERVWTTAVSAFEVRFGLARLAEGRRRAALEAAFEALLREDLAGRVAPLDRAAAEAAGLLAARRTAAGRVVDVRDTLIAGIAHVDHAAGRRSPRIVAVDVRANLSTKFTRPLQFGPMKRVPPERAIFTLFSWSSIPSLLPVSANPDVNIVTNGTVRLAHSSSAPGTAAAGRTMPIKPLDSVASAPAAHAPHIHDRLSATVASPRRASTRPPKPTLSHSVSHASRVRLCAFTPYQMQPQRPGSGLSQPLGRPRALPL